MHGSKLPINQQAKSETEIDCKGRGLQARLPGYNYNHNI